MRVPLTLALCALLASTVVLPALAQSVAPPFNTVYSVVDLGTVAGLPTPFGGLTVKSGDTNRLLMGGGANTANGRIYEVPVVRGAGNHIVSFGTPVALGFGQNNDSGVAYGPGGVLFHSRYPSNEVVQVRPGDNASSRVIGLPAKGIPNSPGAIAFVPPGYNGAGRLKISSYAGGVFYDVPYFADGAGTFELGAAVSAASLAGGPEGIIYAPIGSPLFTNQALLITEYSAGKVAAYDTDANGNPVVGTRRDFITGLSGGEGAAIDPVTGDFLFTTFNNGNKVFQIRGFTPPPPRATVAVASSVNPSVFRAGVTFTATVTGVAPVSGTVTFKDNGTDIAGCVNAPVSSGTATCATTALPAGTRRIEAFYSGNSANAASDGSLSQVVNGLPPVAVTGVAISVTTAAATLPGTVTANGFVTTVTFQYGTTPAYGSTASAANTVAPDATAARNATVSNLSCGTTYHFRVSATNGAGTTNGNDATFTTQPCPTLASISPAAGPLARGTTVTLTGTGFRSNMTVSVGGVAAACTPVTLSGSTSARCVMPSGDAGTANVAVNVPGGSSGTVAYAYEAVPSLGSLRPQPSPTAGGLSVSLGGTGFVAGMTVSVDGVANACRPVTVASSTSATCTVPPHSSGIVNFVVTTPGGSSAPLAFRYLDSPVLSAVAPVRGPVAGGTRITLSGSLLGVVIARVNGAFCTDLTIASSTEASCTTPAGVAGPASVTVTNPGGTSSPVTFTYDDVPTVSAVKPSRGPLAGGTVVTVSGTAFVAGATTVSVGGQACAPVTHLSDAKLSCVTPAGTAGAATVSVTTPGGTSAPGTYAYDDVPTLADVSPGQGPVAGGTTLTLTGTSFVAGRTTVSVGGAACASVTVVDTATATCVAPAGSAGIAEVLVTTPGGTSAPGYFTFDNLPTVAAVSPDQGPTAGGTTITVTGAAFVTGATTVTVGGIACTGVAVASDASLTCTTSASTAGVKDVVVTTPGGSAAPGFFTYDDLPVVKVVKPGAGQLAGGTTITLTGSSFVAGSTTVAVGGAACAPVVVTNGSSLTCVTPAGPAGVQELIVTTPGGTSAPRYFTYSDTPTLDGVSPGAGPVAGGTAVTLTGTAFVAGATTVTVGGSPCAGVTVTSDTSLTCTTPARPAGSAGSALVIVTTAGGSGNALSFLYEPVPALASVTPLRGPSAGGTLVTLAGTGFAASGTGVTIGGSACTAVNVVSPTQLTCVTPARPAGTAAVSVTTGGGASNAISYEFDASPTVATVTPSNGPVQGGVTITVTGTAFVGGLTTVTVGGAACAAVTVTGPTSLTCVTPAGAGGSAPVVVTTPGGASPAGTFAYDPVPTLATVAPQQGPVGGGTSITLTGIGFVPGITVVTIGGLPCASVNVASGTSLTCVTPIGAPGSSSVVVSTLSGSSNGVSFVYDSVPSLTSITPSQGSIAGGTTVTVTGLSLVTGGTTVTIGGQPCTGVTVLGPTSLTCVTPPGPAGTAPVVATTANGTSGAIPFAYAVVTVGACGSANGVTAAFMPAGAGLCSAGTASPVLPASPWSWTCAGSGGGATASCSAPNQNTATGTGAARAVLSGGTWIVDAANTAGFIPVTGHPKSPPVAVAGVTFPHGLFDFRLINGAAGSAATITITYPQPLPAGTQYWKYGPTPAGFNCTGAACAAPHWYVMPATISGSTVTLTITDGGVGDDDLAANSVIVDQGGPGVPVPPAAAVPVPTLSEWALLVLAALMALTAGRPLRRWSGARPPSA